MLRKLTLEQINDWFTIGKTVTDVELLGAPPAFPAEAAREEAQHQVVAPGACPTAQAPAQAPAPDRPAAAFGRRLEGGRAKPGDEGSGHTAALASPCPLAGLRGPWRPGASAVPAGKLSWSFCFSFSS
ncbi:hypothetical protein P7K49_018698 [Saguinus oedipus]|uniref:Uncharacterized protein n=1 Tax=Saguinus oedipus TaxID=9490 RepID=A0ABQ9V8V8_SAGOE|nr:hypothetical protein P7K49_018698 [Saguinus oedipus]